MPHNSSPPSPLLEPGRSSLCAPTALEPDSSDLCPMDVDDAKSLDDPFTDFSDLAASPRCRPLPDLHYDVEDPFDGSPSRCLHLEDLLQIFQRIPQRSSLPGRLLNLASSLGRPCSRYPVQNPTIASQSTDFYCVAYTGSTAIIRVRLVAFQVEQYLAYVYQPAATT
jgi:hypothetical protein